MERQWSVLRNRVFMNFLQPEDQAIPAIVNRMLSEKDALNRK